MKGAAIEAPSNRYARLSANGIALILAAFFLTFDFHALNGFLVDSYFRTQGTRAPDPEIFLIAFDAAATQGGETDLPAQQLAGLLHKLNAAKPRAIGILADLDQQHYSQAELEEVVSALDSSVPVFVGFTDDALLGRKVPEVFGDRLAFSPGLVSRDSFNFGADSVSRRVLVEIARTPTFYARLATFLRGKTPSHTVGLGESRHAYINWQGPPGTYPLHSAWSFSGPHSKDWDLQGKVVLVGHARRNRPLQDFILTPYSRRLGETPVLEGAAHSIVTLLRDDSLQRLPKWIIALLTVATALLTVNVAITLSPARGILAVVSLLVGLWVSGWVGLRSFGWWLDLAQPMLMALTGYYLVVPFRLGLEYRKRWHYQQKTELLAQIEQLKTNFLSLVSHDLKTPIARIQGNAELLLREELAEKQKRNLQAIVTTTGQMSDYVEAVLDLTRIESAPVPLVKTSRDINETLREVLDEKRFLAQEKNITLKTDLEPLFSIKYDVRLMRRVLGNLVENAIKYSPPDTTITVASREEKDSVALSIQDEGYGIPEAEQAKVFDKFYRLSTPEAQATKGTGLGLYLVKYFVELHKGLVRLQSVEGKGSTFTVSLPV
ncbi:CHASE2 domain-containing protein [bacterium]|nr:CHASE2 domain-containing protein [bacterium]